MVMKVGQCCTSDPSDCKCANFNGKCNCVKYVTCPHELTTLERRIKHYSQIYLSAVRALNRLRWLVRNRRISHQKFVHDKLHLERVRDRAAHKLAHLKANNLSSSRHLL
mgnify:CR=1 FL=1